MKLVSVASRINKNSDVERYVNVYRTEGFGYRVHIEGVGEYARPQSFEKAIVRADWLSTLSVEKIKAAMELCRLNESLLYEPSSDKVVTVFYTDDQWRAIKYVGVKADSIQRLDSIGKIRFKIARKSRTESPIVVMIPYEEMYSDLEIVARYGPGITYRKKEPLITPNI